MNDDYDFEEERAEMVAQLREYGIEDERVLAAMGRIRRHVFIPEGQRWISDPYGDHPCKIDGGQTISQPYIVAYMTELLEIQKGDRVLEIGAGSGYQAAVLAEVGAQVVSLEVRADLAESARKTLDEEGYSAVEVIHADGFGGVKGQAEFDALIGTCAAEKLPPMVAAELREGGRFVLPVGTTSQKLVRGTKENGELVTEEGLSVVFVPMVREEKS